MGNDATPREGGICSSLELGSLMCSVLGLNANRITSMRIDILPDDVAHVDVSIALTLGQCHELADALQRYKLVRRETDDQSNTPAP